jgi:hypothetical protein
MDGRGAERGAGCGAAIATAAGALEASRTEATLYRRLRDCYERLQVLVGERRHEEIVQQARAAEDLVAELRRVAAVLGPVRTAPATMFDAAATARLRETWAESARWLRSAIERRDDVLKALGLAQAATQQDLAALGRGRMALGRYHSPAGLPQLQCRRV